MNNVSIIGTITRDVELKYLPSGTPLGVFAIAVNQDYMNKEGVKVEKVSFFDIKVIGKQSETINKFFAKGSRIGISGELEQETWTAQDGTNRSRVIIKLSSFSFIDRKADSKQSNNQQQSYQSQPQQQYRQPEVHYEQQSHQRQPQQSLPDISLDDEIPF